MPVTRASNNKARSRSGSDQASAVDIHDTVENEESAAGPVVPVGGNIAGDESTNRRKRRALGWEKDNRPPRPANAFISFKSALKDGPHKREYATRLATGENIGVIAQQMWKALNDDERDSWYAAAKKAKMEHSKKYPDYKYQPRKGRDKKKVSRRRVSHGNDPDEEEEDEDDAEEYSEDADTSVVGAREEAGTSAFTPNSDLSEDVSSKHRGEPRLVEVYMGGSEDLDALHQDGWKWALIRDYEPRAGDTADELDIKNPIVHVPSAPAESSSSNPLAIELISMASVLNNVDTGPETPESSMHLHSSGEATMFQQMFNPWDFPAPQPSAFFYDGQPLEAPEGLMKLAST